MNRNYLFSALDLLLVIEGIQPFINPAGYKNTMMQMTQLPDQTLRTIGFGSMLAGVLFLYLVRG